MFRSDSLPWSQAMALLIGIAMDNNPRFSSAYSSLKSSQRRLGELLSSGLGEPARSKMSEVLAEMAQAQDDLIVLRETLQSLEFDNAALRQKLRDHHALPEEGPPC